MRMKMMMHLMAPELLQNIRSSWSVGSFITAAGFPPDSAADSGDSMNAAARLFF